MRQRTTWRVLERERYLTILHDAEATDKRSAAVQRLGDSPFALLDADEAGSWLPSTPSPDPNCWPPLASLVAAPTDGSRVYLVRGLAWGGVPVWTRIWVAPSSQSIWVHQGTAETMGSPGWHRDGPLPSPVLVALPFRPADVYVSAE